MPRAAVYLKVIMNVRFQLIAAAACAAVACTSFAADLKIAVVNPQRILSQSAPAVAAQQKLQDYFKSREDSLNARIRAFKQKAQDFEKNSATMTDSQRLSNRQQLAETERDIAREQRALVDERNQRSNEEVQIILSRANRIIQDIAKKQNYDLILQEAVYASSKIDITDQVIKQLGSGK